MRAPVLTAALTALAFTAFLPAAPAHAGALELDCSHAALKQGGLALCRTTPGVEIRVNGDAVGRADEDGWAHVGFARMAASPVTIEARAADGVSAQLTVELAAQEYNIQRIDGLPPSKVAPRTPEQQKAVERSWVAKRGAFEAKKPGQGFLSGFVRPAEGQVTGVYGSQRILNGDPKNPHLGLDIANAEGTPVVSPAAGVVTLADPDLYFEGGSVFIDHGEGLVSILIHLSAVEVEPGQVVEQGERIGAMGSTGRSTGPHVHWGLKWRDRHYIDPQLALDLGPPPAAG